MKIIIKLYKNGNIDRNTLLKILKIYSKYNRVHEDGLISMITGRKRGAQPGNQNRKGTGKGTISTPTVHPPSPTTSTEGIKPVKAIKPMRTPKMPNSDRPLGEVNEEKPITYKMNRRTPQQNMQTITGYAGKQANSAIDIAQQQREAMEQLRRNSEMLKKINVKY